MNRAVLQHELSFLVGVLATSMFLWGRIEDPARALATVPVSAPDAIEEHEISAVPVTPSPARKIDPLRAQMLMDTALPVIRACDPQERAARWSLLLTQLRNEGESGIAAIAAFLATGEDLPIGPRLDLPGVTLEGSTTLRMAALDQVNYAESPSTRQLHIDENRRSMNLVGTGDEAVHAMQMLDFLDPGKHRAEAIAAMQRIATNSDSKSMRALIQVASHFGAVELLPLAEKHALQQPEDGIPDLLGTLWKMPADKREEVTQRVLSNRNAASQINSGALAKLDYRLPAAREFATAWFGAARPATEKAAVIEQLGSDRDWSPRYGFPGDQWQPDPQAGTPGTAAQAEARLALLEQLSPLISEPLAQQKLVAARAHLEQQIAK